MTYGMKIIEPQQENFHVYFKNRGWELAVPKALLKYPERLSHQLIYQTYVRAIRPSSFEIVEYSPHNGKPRCDGFVSSRRVMFSSCLASLSLQPETAIFRATYFL